MSAIQHVQIRQPAVANLLIDSKDVSGSYPDNFTIQKNQSILNGFFHRIATSEVVLNWSLPNINSTNSTFSITYNAVVSTVTLSAGFYTAAEVLDTIVALLNALALGITFSITTPANPRLTATGNFILNDSTLAQQLSLGPYVGLITLSIPVTSPDLRPFRYIDFISPQLTYNQKLKDATTGKNDMNVLCRWYFAWDQPTTVDTYGFPVLMGYTSFVARRLFNPAKQIRWENNMPVGQIAFQLFGDGDRLIGATVPISTADFNWQMTLQVSED